MKHLILAAGLGSRLNYLKYDIKINGYTLLEHTYYKIDRKNDIFVVYKDDNIRKNHTHLKVTWLKNDRASIDKNISIKIGLKAIKGDCILLLADMPCYEKKHLEKIKTNKSTFSFDGDTLLPPLFLKKNDIHEYLKRENRILKDIITDYNYVKCSKENLRDIDTYEDVIKMRKNIVIISGGDLASATINLLAKEGFNVYVIELDKPLAVRRSVSYSEAMHDGFKIIADIKCLKVNNSEECNKALLDGNVVISNRDIFNKLDIEIDCLIDITLRKKRIKYLNNSYLTVGVGPAFVAKEDVDYVIESQRGDSLGKIIDNGCALENTGVPQSVLNYTMERVLYSKNSGFFNSEKNIGSKINKGEVFGYVDNQPVYAKIDGRIRGMIRTGTYVDSKTKIGDIDPKNNNIDITKFSDKSLMIAKSALKICKGL